MIVFIFQCRRKQCEDPMDTFFKCVYFHIDIQESCNSIIYSRFSTFRFFSELHVLKLSGEKLIEI
jgi:hypothetical protein